ncbi:MAG: VWA domain-containing protein, partial [Candidatus Hydrogenedentes bacterium]|nr:VWA domain-containing protein [Candidatus Hydrogenedentota bacterium]
MRNSKTLNMSMNVFWGLFAAACFSCGAHAQSLSLAGHDYVSTRVTSGNVWALLDLRNASGKPVTGLDLAQVTVRESLVDVDTGAAITAPREVDVAAQAATAWMEAGLWEKTVGDLKLDIVFMADGTASNGTAVASLRSDMHAFTDTLLAHHVDFRMAVASFGEVPVGLDPSPFYGPTEIEKLRAEIDAFPQMGGDGWSPTVAYDAVMNSVWSGFREDAHQVVVVVTDIAPQTVYGTFWYAGGCIAATLSGMELFLKAHDFHLFFSHDANTSGDPDYQFYCDPDINPRAGIDETGFEALAKKKDAFGRPLAVNLGWPFQQENLQAAIRQRVAPTSIFLAPMPVVESAYVISWVSDLEWYDDIEVLPGAPEDLLYRADISVAVPGSKVTRSTFCTYPTKKIRTPVTINVSDEHGNPQDDSWSYLEPLMGDRPLDYLYQLSPTDGQIFLDNVPEGEYFLSLLDGGCHPHSYEGIRGVSRFNVHIPPEGAMFDIALETIDKHADLARTRGLLKDLADWRSPGDPFQDFANDANAWLDALSADGITWMELVRIKRFEVALSGYAAITEYAHLQTEGAIEDFYQILMDFIAII